MRAKRTLAAANVPFEVPAGDELAPRLGSVLEVVYLIFNEGYSASAGDDWMRPALCEDALRLGRILAALCPREPEVHGLVALMEIQASRLRARVDARGAPGPAARPGPRALGSAADPPRAGRRWTAQSRWAGRWAPTPCRPRSPPATRAPAAPSETDWERIAALYDALAQLSPSPIVELNRAVALSMAFGPAEGLALLDELAAGGSLAGYHRLAAVRGDLLARLGRIDEARVELARAAEQTENAQERSLLVARIASL